MRGITVEDFNNYDDAKQKFLLCDAGKVSENKDELLTMNYDIDNIFIEVKIYRIEKKYIKAFSLTGLPSTYAALVWTYLKYTAP
ncbi:hypothetical protein [Segetibacter koreensis]|uniref:hypothetical protein n=1 Tax=Segetibacter koreensis TaxID=398037 RepID=UPI00037C11E3|nr:hypothetical protein [Segetibacter koreensis]